MWCQLLEILWWGELCRWHRCFLILLVIKFAVITSGAGRVAEVAAVLHWIHAR